MRQWPFRPHVTLRRVASSAVRCSPQNETPTVAHNCRLQQPFRCTLPQEKPYDNGVSTSSGATTAVPMVSIMRAPEDDKDPRSGTRPQPCPANILDEGDARGNGTRADTPFWRAHIVARKSSLILSAFLMAFELITVWATYWKLLPTPIHPPGTFNPQCRKFTM